MQEATSLWALFIASFLAATLLPGGSEAALFGVVKMHPGQLWLALSIATLGNTLGGMTSYVIGRVVPRPVPDPQTRVGRWQQRAQGWAERHGAAAMLGAWLPVIGDPLCVAAGWLRLKPLPVILYMAAGKFARYAAIAWTAA